MSDIIQAPDGPFGLASPIYPGAISPNGRYVCGSFNPGGIGYDRGFWYDTTTQQFHIVPMPQGAYQLRCRDVSDAGWIVGSYATTTIQWGFVYDITQGTIIHLLPPLPGGAWNIPTGINSRHEVCGHRSLGMRGDPANPLVGYIWDQLTGFRNLGTIDDQATLLYAISDNGIAAGTTRIDNVPVAFTWNGRRITWLTNPPGGGATPSNLNDESMVVGTSLKPISTAPFIEYHAAAWHDTFIVELGRLPGDIASFANDLTPSGMIVGMSRRTTYPTDRGFVWQHARLRDLNALVTRGSPFVTNATEVAESGMIVCGIIGPRAEDLLAILEPRFQVGDSNGDCLVDTDDLLVLLGNWLLEQSPADFNADGIVDGLDLISVLNNWSR